MSNCIYWLIGRGASISCNLRWEVPPELRKLERTEQIKEIKSALKTEMDSAKVTTEPYRQFLYLLGNHTVEGWRHSFVTTNWDYLLQKEINNLGLTILPSWLSSSHVYHINGTVEDLEDNSNRSPFILEDDGPEQRIQTVEGNTAFTKMIWGQIFVVIGMSFECKADKFLLSSLNKIEDDLPIGESIWLIINPNEIVLNQSAQRIQRALPQARVCVLKEKFDGWVQNKMPELKNEGILKDGARPDKLE